MKTLTDIVRATWKVHYHICSVCGAYWDCEDKTCTKDEKTLCIKCFKAVDE